MAARSLRFVTVRIDSSFRDCNRFFHFLYHGFVIVCAHTNKFSFCGNLLPKVLIFLLLRARDRLLDV
jgi:hypothetical protein